MRDALADPGLHPVTLAFRDVELERDFLEGFTDQQLPWWRICHRR